MIRVCFLSLSFAGFVSVVHVQTPAALRNGLIFPFTRSSQELGNSARRGAELTVKEINEVGCGLGRHSELVERDDKASSEEGRTAAEEFVVRQKVDFTIGFCNTGPALQSLDVFQRNDNCARRKMTQPHTLSFQPPQVLLLQFKQHRAIQAML